jgi:hypothetical protein
MFTLQGAYIVQMLSNLDQIRIGGEFVFCGRVVNEPFGVPALCADEFLEVA